MLRGSASASVSVRFHPPDGRRRDLDNLLASVKAGLDGISEAVQVDDSRWLLAVERATPVRRGRVVVTVEAT